MANTNIDERETKAKCLLNAFEVLKEKSERDGRNFVSVASVVALANEDELMKTCNSKIGDKSIYTKAKNSLFPPILEAINIWCKEYKTTSKKANNKCSERVKKLDNKLSSAEEMIIELQDKIHELKRRLENKDFQIEQIEKDRNTYSQELYILRKKYEHS